MILKGFEDLKRFLEKPKNIVIVGHRNPDGDAMGSSLALKYYLDKKGHQATVIVPNEYPEFLHWLPGTDKVYRFDKQNSQSLRLLMLRILFFFWTLTHCIELVLTCKLRWKNTKMTL